MNKREWFVRVYDNGALFFSESFETRGKAAAYVMRWNKAPNLRWRAEMVPPINQAKPKPRAR
jgi:hypothetical protein